MHLLARIAFGIIISLTLSLGSFPTYAQAPDSSDSSKGLFSKYYHPAPGETYHYGNFCGPGVPAFLKEISIEETKKRLSMLLKTKAVDDIDGTCKFHDVCFEVLGHNNPYCDLGLINTLHDTDPTTKTLNTTIQISLFPQQQLLRPHFDGGCGYLAYEIALGIGTYMSVKQKGSAIDRIPEAASGALDAGTSPLRMAEISTRRRDAGPLPEAAGTCSFSDRYNKGDLIADAYDHMISGYVYSNCSGNNYATSASMASAITNAIMPRSSDTLIARSASVARGMSVPKYGYYPSDECVAAKAEEFKTTVLSPDAAKKFWPVR